jgi:hypothetical protein
VDHLQAAIKEENTVPASTGEGAREDARRSYHRATNRYMRYM